MKRGSEALLGFLILLEAVVLIMLHLEKNKQIEDANLRIQQQYNRQKEQELEVIQRAQECHKSVSLYNRNFDPMIQDVVKGDALLLRSMYSHEPKQELKSWNGRYQAADVLAMIPTGYNTLNRAAGVRETWAKFFGKVLFISDTDEPALPTAQTVSNSKWEGSFARTKVLEGLSHAAEFINDYKWFLKLDDDAFAIMENILAVLEKYDYQQPWYIGAAHYEDRYTYCDGGAGYAISREALRIITQRIHKKQCIQDMHEDAMIGRCFYDAGVNCTFHREYQPRSISQQMFRAGIIHQYPATFHKLTPHQLLEMYWLLYQNDLNKTVFYPQS